ncbi:hypothetical protein [Thalassomonas sp. M1454]|uniref:hypothetical protein n=1 Tax=Thalassomonas sp. M1454 TaxID=2594477 RepID=UPI00117DBFC7|nr:hypothetical protein [Thalassomonas sp. M1454]TRX56481.1 hypothetical protein FNN08_02815 [Thalassomonas sp. M1454]
MKILRNTIVSIFTMLFILIPPAFAADKEVKSLAEVWLMTPNPGQVVKFEQAFIEHLKYRKSKGDPRNWNTYVPTIGKDLSNYTVRFCCTAFKDVSAYNDWANKNKIGEHWNNTVAAYVAKYEHYFDRVDLENGHWPNNGKKYKFFEVTTYDVKMGHGKNTEQSKKVISDHAKAMKWAHSWGWSWRSAGDGGLMLVVPFEDYADMAPLEKSFGKSLAEHLGSEDKADAVFADWTSNFNSAQTTVWMKRDDLSISDD